MACAVRLFYPKNDYKTNPKNPCARDFGIERLLGRARIDTTQMRERKPSMRPLCADINDDLIYSMGIIIYNNTHTQ